MRVHTTTSHARTCCRVPGILGHNCVHSVFGGPHQRHGILRTSRGLCAEARTTHQPPHRLLCKHEQISGKPWSDGCPVFDEPALMRRPDVGVHADNAMQQPHNTLRHQSVSRANTSARQQGWAGFQLRGGGGFDTALWLAPPKKAQWTAPPNSYRDGPPAPGGDTDPNLGNKMEIGFWNQRVEGVQNVTICHVFFLGGGAFQWSKMFSVPSAPESIITDSWCCQLSPFPEPPPPPLLGGSIDPRLPQQITPKGCQSKVCFCDSCPTKRTVKQSAFR